MYELPIYKEYYLNFLDLIKELDGLRDNKSHHDLINKAYNHAIEIFPKLNAGYNY